MRILFLAQLLPFPLDAGPKIRAHYVLQHLARAGHDVRLLCFVRPGDRVEDVRRLREFCSSVDTVPLHRSRLGDVRHGLRSVLTRTAFLIQRDQIPEMRRRLKIITDQRSFDALHIDQLWMASYGMGSPGVGFRVLDQHNAVFMVLQRLAENERNPLAKVVLGEEARKLEAFERDACNGFSKVVWVTEEDRRALRSAEHGNDGHDEVIPIAIDPSAWPPIERPRPFRVTFVGGLHWPPNSEGVSWFAEQVWPRVSRAAPESVLTLIGRGASRKIRQLAKGPGVEVIGYIADTAAYFSETSVCIVPIRSGAGMRVKILDAWCRGLPVVSTPVGAEGIKAIPGENMLLADSAESFAESVLAVMRDRNLARRLSDGGRATVEDSYDWKEAYKAWDGIYR